MKIDWYACGGVSQLENAQDKICPVQTCVKSVDDVLDPPFNPNIVSRDNEIRELEQALREVMMEDAELDSFRSDKQANMFVDAHAAAFKDSRFELRIPLKAEIEELPDNRVMAGKLLDIL